MWPWPRASAASMASARRCGATVLARNRSAITSSTTLAAPAVPPPRTADAFEPRSVFVPRFFAAAPGLVPAAASSPAFASVAPATEAPAATVSVRLWIRV